MRNGTITASEPSDLELLRSVQASVRIYARNPVRDGYRRSLGARLVIQGRKPMGYHYGAQFIGPPAPFDDAAPLHADVQIPPSRLDSVRCLVEAKETLLLLEDEFVDALDYSAPKSSRFHRDHGNRKSNRFIDTVLSCQRGGCRDCLMRLVRGYRNIAQLIVRESVVEVGDTVSIATCAVSESEIDAVPEPNQTELCIFAVLRQVDRALQHKKILEGVNDLRPAKEPLKLGAIKNAFPKGGFLDSVTDPVRAGRAVNLLGHAWARRQGLR